MLIFFAGSLFPVNERATRTIPNLYVKNERVNLICHYIEHSLKFNIVVCYYCFLPRAIMYDGYALSYCQ
jgi:hypothetical protein